MPWWSGWKDIIMPSAARRSMLTGIFLLVAALTTAATKSPSRLRRISSAFDKVWDGSELHIDRTLDACHVFARILETSGPRAVHLDFCANLKKAEDLVARARKGGYKTETLKQALKYEQDVLQLHDGNKLKDPSGAVGFLWMRRSLQFQASLYDGLSRGMSPQDAALSSYKTQLRPYHGPILRRFYIGFLRYKMPSRESIFRVLGEVEWNHSSLAPPIDESMVMSDMIRVVKTLRPVIRKWRLDFDELEIEDKRQT